MGERVNFNGTETQLRNISEPPTPVLMTAAGPRMLELAGEVADGALMLVGLHPRGIAAARRRLEIGAQRAGRDLRGCVRNPVLSLAKGSNRGFYDPSQPPLSQGRGFVTHPLRDFQTIFITPMTVDVDDDKARRWPQQWFRPDQPYLKYPSASNLIWLRESGIDLPDDVVPEEITDDQAIEICDAFGLFGTATECLSRIKRACSESGVEQLFIFPTHTQEGGYDMPYSEVDAFRNVIFPGLRSE